MKKTSLITAALIMILISGLTGAIVALGEGIICIIPDIGPHMNHAEAGSDIQITSAEQSSTVIQATVHGPGCNNLQYRWLGEGTVLLDWQDVQNPVPIYFVCPDDTQTFLYNAWDASLDLAQVPSLSNGDHTLTLELSSSCGVTSDSMVLTVTADLPEGIISYWKFDDCTATDSVGANHGIIDAEVQCVDGRAGKALDFSAQYHVTIPDDPSLEPQFLTLEAWFSPTDYSGGYRSIVNKPYRSTPWNNPWNLYFLMIQYTTLKPEFAVSTGDAPDGRQRVLNTQPVIQGEWSHFVGTYDGVTLKVYINGEFVDSKDAAPNGPIDSRYSTAPLYFGGVPNTNNYYYGKIDEVAIYNRPLTPAEIQQHYQNGLNGHGYEEIPFLYVDVDGLCGGNLPCYTNIQNAVNDANVGDTVYVYAGIYNEHVTIDKFLTLQGEDRETTIIDGGGSGTVVTAFANNVTVTGFKITNGDLGLRGAWRDGNVFSNNEVYGNDRGIHLDSMTNSYVENNKVYSNGSGISVGYMAHSNTIRNNVVRDNSLGINFGAEVHLAPNYAYHNDLINNETQSNSSNNSNEWDDGSIGNYWSDYTGVDDDGDGIGDTPYQINSDSCCSYDNYPRMSPFNIFEIRETIAIPPEHSGARARVWYVGDLDFDGNLDIEYTYAETDDDPYSTFVIERDGSTFVNRFTELGYGIRVAEVDGDNYPEIYVSTSQYNAKIFEATGDNTYAEKYAMSFSPRKIEPYPEAGDSDGDGKREFLVPAEWVGVRIYEADSNDTYVLETTLALSGNGNIRSIGVYDLDGDGHLETVFTQNPYDNDQNTLYVFEEVNGNRVQIYSSFVYRFMSSSLGDLDGNGRGEIIGVTYLDNYLRIYESQGSNNDFQIVYEAPRDPSYPYSLGLDNVMDFDGDGQSELWRPMFDVFTLAHRDGGTITDFYNSGELLQGLGEIRGLLAVGDTNGDGRLELAVVQGDQIHILEQTINTDADGDGYKFDIDCDDSDSSVNPGATEVPYNGKDDDCNPSTPDDDLDNDTYVAATDCNDNDASVNPGAAEVPYNGEDDDCNPSTPDDDLDNDTYVAATDCNDNDASVNPGATEVPYNGEDDDCNPSTPDDDLDNDTYVAATDCNDNDASVNPGATEVPYNSKDDDCNASTPDNDLDGDGHAALSYGGDDCNDEVASIHPGAPETCNGVDDNCDGEADEGVESIFYADVDTDGYGDPNNTTLACSAPAGYVADDTDCNDGSNAIYPGAAEVCNAIDDDCDAATADGSQEVWLGTSCDGADSDLCEEGVYECSAGSQSCSDTSSDNLDLCDGADNDCNAATADGSQEVWLGTSCDGADSDLCEEGTYECTAGSQSCSDSSGDDIEVCDNVDNDCDGAVDEGLTQPTSCGVGECAGNSGTETCTAGAWGGDTCDPLAGAVAETCDNLDNNCNGSIDEGLTQSTSCGVGACTSTGEETCSGGSWGGDTCTPETPSAEICDNVDNNCNGTVDEGLTQATSCGVGACAGNTGIATCTAGTWGGDTCNPFFGAATESCDNIDNDCDGSIDEEFHADGDGIADCFDNCLLVDNPGQSDIDDDGAGDLCDECPADPLDECNSEGSTAEEIPADQGGTVETPDGDLAIDIDPNDLAENETISVTQTVHHDPEVDLSVGTNPGRGQAIAVYDLEPDGSVFDSPVTLTIIADVTGLNPNQLSRLNIYIFEDTDGDEVEDTFVPICEENCCNVDQNIATCTAEVIHFSHFALLAPLDRDDDGIPDMFGNEQDHCPTLPVQESMSIDYTGHLVLPISSDTATPTLSALLTYDDNDQTVPAADVPVGFNCTDGNGSLYGECAVDTDSDGIATCSEGEVVDLGPGVYTVGVVSDKTGCPTASTQALLAVYDPDGGFVTGGGWIDSPAGAYAADPSLTGKANFGFVSQYKKGATVPTGKTEFNFKAGDLNFHSDKYEWLVVNQNGTNAQFRGSGTINGDLTPTGEAYKFMLWAGDGDPDTFRIRIWEEDEESGDETDVYDNGFDQAIGGGSIKVHTK